MSEDAKCEVCQKLAAHRCGGCHNIHYCSKEHQKNDWKHHKKQCRPFKIHSNDTIGRHVKATKDIKAGDLILQEQPLIWGPSQNTIPVCLGCCKAVNENNSRACSKCGWPMCSAICEKAPAHIPECRYTVLRGDKISIRHFGVPHPSYQCITVLRILYQKQFLPEVWKRIERLQSSCEERKGTEKYERERKQIAQFVLKFFKLNVVFNEDEIMKVCGIVMINSHEVPLTQQPHIAIYEQTSMFEHNCRANCSKTFSSKGGIVITAGTNIKKGDNLSICYTDPLWGTPNRRYHLHESKLFWCSCERCVDPTEFGTFFSALRCQDSNCSGHLLPKIFIDNSTDKKSSDWYCTKCNSTLSPYSAQDLLDRIGKDLSEMPKGDIRECKNFIQSYEELLHRNHYYLTDVKLALLHLIGDEDGGLNEVDDDDLQLKMKSCQNLISLLKILVPGEKRVRGVILFELHAVIGEFARRKCSPDVVYTSLLESKTILQEAVDLLKYEPEEISEGKIYKQAVANLQELDVVLQTVHKAIGQMTAPI